MARVQETFTNVQLRYFHNVAVNPDFTSIVGARIPNVFGIRLVNGVRFSNGVRFLNGVQFFNGRPFFYFFSLDCF